MDRSPPLLGTTKSSPPAGKTGNTYLAISKPNADSPLIIEAI
jgi:hypothetical protein